ncbi:glucokinase [Methylomagnum ishizawai]|uniref:glucokinase n=1 Tax=Methylomagnum ishizawai TaxID=1760988 RepID=UPI001C32A7F5|nr:glucokinase [Methylomagnum ishizawai]BBL76737.1 glucokinase [Methylomagnum ishizawai]
MLLAGDVGGTKTVLAQYEKSTEGLERVRERLYPSADYASLDEIVADFLSDQSVPLEAACFGVAGPVIDGRCYTTNLPWTIDERSLAATTGVGRVKLLNDLQAMALGLLRLGPEEWADLNPDAEPATGNRAVLAAGTGLGEAILYWDGMNYHPVATEGGHTDFAPNDALEDGLLAYLREKLGGHVSYERILSGPGIANIYAYLRDSGHAPESPELAAALADTDDPAREISRCAMERGDALARASLRVFARIYGAEAGNLVLKCLARGGVLIGGGIAPKILAALTDGEFMEGFCAKGRFAGFMRTVPVRVALNPSTGLLGAADYAARCLL